MGSGVRGLRALVGPALSLALLACDGSGVVNVAANGAEADDPTAESPPSALDAADGSTADASRETDVAHVRRVLGVYATPRGQHRTYVLIDAGLSDDEVVELARSLHGIDPDTAYHLMDSDAAFEKMLAALPATAEGDYADWPAAYVESHLVAYLERVSHLDGKGGAERRWRVVGGPVRERLVRELRREARGRAFGSGRTPRARRSRLLGREPSITLGR